MKPIPLLCLSVAIGGLFATSPASAIPTRHSDAAVSASEVSSSCLGWYGSSGWSDTFQWQGAAENDMAFANSPDQAGFRSLRLLVLDRLWNHNGGSSDDNGTVSTPPPVVVANNPPVTVPDGGTTLALLVGSLCGLVIASRRFVGFRA